MFVLDDVNTKLQLVTSTGADVDVSVEFVDVVAGTSSELKSQETAITTATTTDILAVPGASTQRRVHKITVVNKDTTTQTVYIVKDVSATDYRLTPTVTLLAGESVQVNLDGSITVYNSLGVVKIGEALSRYNGRAIPYLKIGIAPEAAGNFYSFCLNPGNPGAWATGSPGVNGRQVIGTDTADFGCIPWQNAATGAIYMTNWDLFSSRIGGFELFDYLWVNTGLSPTTTTNQAITSGAMPARDVNGSTNGVGLGIGILVTGAITTAVSTSTCTYTNSEGTAGRTASMQAQVGYQMPATATVGTFIPLTLQAGDIGVRSIEGFTVASTYTAGTYSLIVYRKVAAASVLAANTGNLRVNSLDPGVKLYSGSALFPHVAADGTTLYTTTGVVTVMER